MRFGQIGPPVRREEKEKIFPISERTNRRRDEEGISSRPSLWKEYLSIFMHW